MEEVRTRMIATGPLTAKARSTPSQDGLTAVRFVVCVLALFCQSGCWRTGTRVAEPAPADWFEEISAAAGLNFVHDAGTEDGNYFMPQIIGSGAALFDFNNDGRLDIYLLQNAGPNSRSKNQLLRQEANGRFTDVSAGSGLDFAGHCMGVAIGDVNNDGWPDVVVTMWHGIRLFMNNGNDTFTDVTVDAKLENLHWGTSACFVDYDRDGWLDLVVANYVDYDAAARCADGGGRPAYCHPSDFRGAVTTLFHNRGRSAAPTQQRARFDDVTLRSGLGKRPGPGLGVAAADFNGDGWPDIFVANDDKPNHLWINQHDGTFAEQALVCGVAYNARGQSEAGMGVAIADVNGDGLFDLLVTHLTEETHTLWLQGPPGFFQDRTAAHQLAGSDWRGTGFGTVLADFDHDGGVDLAVVNGRVARGTSTPNALLPLFWRDYSERNQLFANDGHGRFIDQSVRNRTFCGTPLVSRGLACGDIDNDGALDLLVTTIAGPARLYRNVAQTRGNWLVVRALAPEWKRDAYGARITITTDKRQHVRWINPGQSYLCSHDPRAHFGIGASKHIDRIEVHWPDGVDEEFQGSKANQVVTVRKGEGTVVSKRETNRSDARNQSK